jgi:RNA polymerase sigma factor for flagellar operon FliA
MQVKHERDSDALVLEHLDLVQHVVNEVSMRYPRHVEREERWNAGACGIVEAARRYRPETEVPFARYAQTRIRGAIIDSTRTRDWAGRAIRRKTREIRDIEARFEEENGRRPGDEELASRLGVSIDELHARRAEAASSSVLHLDHAYPDRDALAEALPESGMESLPEEALDQQELLGTLRTAIEHLPEPQQDVLRRYYLAGEMLQDIARSMNVTEARASQICSEAINAIRAYMGELYDGVPEVGANAPGKRSRAAYLKTVSARSTWRQRLAAGGPRSATTPRTPSIA